MRTKPNSLILHSTVTKWSTLVMDVELARALEFDGIEVSAHKVRNYLDAGYKQVELERLIEGLSVPALGFVTDLERQGDSLPDLLKEADEQFCLAKQIGAEAVQIITGPIDVRAVIAHRDNQSFDGYSGLLGRTPEEQVALTASNLAHLADLAGSYGLLVYLEALAWTPLNTLKHQLDVIARADRSNIRLVIDFWHSYASGDGPAEIALVPKELIFGVHLCDSLAFEGGIPDERLLRDVSTGAGVLDLQEWVGAVKSTGYEGWWSCELFSKRDQQGNSHAVAKALRDLMQDLVSGEGASARPLQPIWNRL